MRIVCPFSKLINYFITVMLIILKNHRHFPFNRKFHEKVFTFNSFTKFPIFREIIFDLFENPLCF